MYCPRCGQASKESDRFCGSCGLDLTVYQAPQYRPVASYEQVAPYGPVASYGPLQRIPSYLGWAIAVMILCFWPTGIAAVVYASQVDSKLAARDYFGAQESSRKARMWCWITFAIGVVLWVISIVIFIAIIATLPYTGHEPGGGVFY